eukprot:c25644_g1_i1 orf=32-328(+)
MVDICISSELHGFSCLLRKEWIGEWYFFQCILFYILHSALRHLGKNALLSLKALRSLYETKFSATFHFVNGLKCRVRSGLYNVGFFLNHTQWHHHLFI